MKMPCLSLSLLLGILITLAAVPRPDAELREPEPLKPIGQAQGTNPGRVVWVHDAAATNWKGPGDGHWWETNHTSQTHVDRMLSSALRQLTGQSSERLAWDTLFRYLNQRRGKGDVAYKPGEKVAIKVNFVGFIATLGGTNPDNNRLEKLRDYMNTSPQMIVALLHQLVDIAGVQPADIAIVDTLAYFPAEYDAFFQQAFPQVKCVDQAGKFGHVKAELSKVPIYWSCRPVDCIPDYVPACFAEAEYLINFANLKAHTGTGVTLCAKNHYGSLVRKPADKGYYDLHPAGFSKEQKIYRPLVDLIGHAHLGGKTVLYLIDGLYPGIHPKDTAPRRWSAAPFNGGWASSLLASQDPVAIDSVGFDFLWTEYEDPARKPGVDDFLHEAALAPQPPSGTFYDPDHATPMKRLPSLGVHEHWNNARERKYSRNLGTGQGIQLVAVELGSSAPEAKK